MVQIPPEQLVIVVSIVSNSVLVEATSSSLSSQLMVAVVVASLVIVVTGTVRVEQTPPGHVVIVVSTVEVSVVVNVFALALIVVTRQRPYDQLRAVSNRSTPPPYPGTVSFSSSCICTIFF